MYCPKCGNEMVLVDGVYKCIDGDMPLSQNLHNELTRLFPKDISEEKKSKWFCPGCRKPLTEDMSCMICGVSIKHLKYQLVEIHPHLFPENC